MRAILLLAFALLASPVQAGLISGRVVHVADGDTITVLDASKVQHKIRLAGIDAPEKAQAYGQRSRESLDELVAGRTVIVETTKKDRYGRFVGKVLVNGRDINIEQIRRGMAWFYRHYEKELPDSDRQSYDRAEVEAKDYRRGLWADRSPTPPWEFRQTKRGQ
jgi:endonuclease YncB( thermonuclease family)